MNGLAWRYYQSFGAFGQRFRKRPRVAVLPVVPEPRYPTERSSSGPYDWHPGPKGSNPRLVKRPDWNTPGGNLENQDYRFWIGAHDPKVKFSQCKACCLDSWSAEQRLEHKAIGCTKILVAAYKLLLRAMLCVICDAETSNTRWGVPICSPGCEERWKFAATTGTCDALDKAVSLAEYETGSFRDGAVIL